MSEYLDVMEEETRNIMEVAYEMKALSYAFYTVGNMTMGETLNFAHKKLLSAQKNINGAVSVEINSRFKSAEQSSFNTVAACLAMNELKNS